MENPPPHQKQSIRFSVIDSADLLATMMFQLMKP